jgi:signal peptidase
MKNLFFSLLNGFTTVLLLGVVALFLVPLLPIPGNIEMKIVKSGSMEPTIMTGGIVVIKPEPSYAVGDVVTFGEDTKEKIPTTHRIIEESVENGTTYFTTKGDANEEQDPQKVAASEVIGKVVFTAPYAGYLLDFSRQPLGFALLVGVPAASLILNELFSIWNELRGKGSHRRTSRRRSLFRNWRGGNWRGDTSPGGNLGDFGEVSPRQKVSPRQNRGQDYGYLELEDDGEIYMRRRSMDDISLPVSRPISMQSTLWERNHHRGRRGINSVLLTCLISASAAGVCGVSLGHVGTTFSYYRDTEHSTGNRLSAAALDFSLIFAILPDTPINLDVTEGDEDGTETIPQVIIDLPSADPEYTVHTEIANQNAFCQALLVRGEGLFNFGNLPVIGLSEGPTTSVEPWKLIFTLPAPAESVNEGDTCAIDLVYEGKIGGEENAYNDKEVIHLILHAHVFEDAPVVVVENLDTPQDPPQDLPQDPPQE